MEKLPRTSEPYRHYISRPLILRHDWCDMSQEEVQFQTDAIGPKVFIKL